MDEQRARALLREKRAEVEQMIADGETSVSLDSESEDEVGDSVDPGEPMVAEEVDGAVVASLQERLAALDRAEARLDAGTYGVSIRSGDPIPDERLEFDPAAELTVSEAEAT